MTLHRVVWSKTQRELVNRLQKELISRGIPSGYYGNPFQVHEFHAASGYTFDLVVQRMQQLLGEQV